MSVRELLSLCNQTVNTDIVFRTGMSRDPSDLGLSEAKVSSNTSKCIVFSQQTWILELSKHSRTGVSQQWCIQHKNSIWFCSSTHLHISLINKFLMTFWAWRGKPLMSSDFVQRWQLRKRIPSVTTNIKECNFCSHCWHGRNCPCHSGICC